MKKNILKALAALSLSAFFITADAAQLGYCSSVANRNNIFRMGSIQTQGMAIKLNGDKLQMLKGCSITGVSALFGSTRTDDGTVDIFVATSPDAAPLATQNVSLKSAVKWTDLAFDTPYIITGEESELYIGYTASINTKSSMLMADFGTPVYGVSYVYNDGEWVDTYPLGCGNVSLKAIIPDAPEFTDVLLQPVNISGYLKASTPYDLTCQLYNFGSQDVTSFDAVVTIGDNAPVKVRYKDLALKQGEIYDFNLENISADDEGTLPMSVEITNVNSGAETTLSDNLYSADLYFYPQAMERSILLEGFTGQTCNNCPAGHTTINNFIEAGLTTPIIEVMHHSGYSPDLMTMDADLDYTYFFNNPSTFAPAMMLNRAHINTLAAQPVLNVSSQLLSSAYKAVEAMPPYVSLALETTFDPLTRELKIDLNTLTHQDLPSETNIINVMLVQNDIVSLQIPYGESYQHNAVFRGCLTGNSWGIMLDEESCVAGGKGQWSATLTLPEGIFSDYYESPTLSDEIRQAYTIPTDPDNMYIVAFVAAFHETDVNGHTVYNCVEAPIGGSHIQGGITSIKDITSDSASDLSIKVADGRIHVDGQYDKLQVYTLSGVQANANSQLTKGVYIVRATNGTTIITRKVIVK